MTITAISQPIHMAATLAPEVTLMTQRLYLLAMRYFDLMQGLFFVGYGTKEITFDARKRSSNDQNWVQELANRPTSLGNFSFGHGLFFLGAGGCGLALSAHQLHYADLSPYSYSLSLGSKLFFIYANLIALEYNANLILESLQDCPFEDADQVARLRISAISGILSSLSYITSTCIGLLGVSSTAALVIGVIGACFGCFKILYDLFLLHKTPGKA